MDFKTAIGETRKLYSGQRRGDAAARCALNEIEHYFVCERQRTDFPLATALLTWQRHLVDTLGNGPSRANSKLSVLRQVFKTGGIHFPDQHVKPLVRSKAPKWVLTEEQEKKLMGWFNDYPGTLPSLIEDYIKLVLETGLRVEEVLRLQLPMLHEKGGHYSLEVPGTKTAGSYDLIPITDKAAKILLRRSLGKTQFAHLFSITYEGLAEAWQQCRAYLDLLDNPTATLKGLRRTFAHRHRHLPPDVLQRLMRHSNLQTTSDYLNVTGMNEELRGWLDGSQTIIGTRAEYVVMDDVVSTNIGKTVTLDPDQIARSMKAAGFSAIDVAVALAAL